MRRNAHTWLGLFVIAAMAFVAALTPSAAAPEQPRIALVIGNGAYPSRPLATATADAGLIAQALAQAGFDVTAAADLDETRLGDTFRAFVEEARGAGPNALVVVYLAGLGVQLDGDNYLVPVDARIEHAADAAHEAASLAGFERALAAVPAAARILVYDLACDNPFAARDGMPLAPGLALEAPPAGTLVAFDAAPGATAPDDAPPYGAYARALAEMIGTPGLPVAVLLDRVRLRVGELTDGAVVPWNAGAVGDGLAILPSTADAPRLTTGSIAAMPVASLSADIAYSAVIARDTFQGYGEFAQLFANDPLAERVRAILTVRREALTFAAAVAADDPRAYWTYVRRYPRGPHLFDARRRLARLGASLEPPPRFDIFAFPDVPPPSPKAAEPVARHDAGPETEPPPIPPPPGAFLPTPVDAFYGALPPPGPAPAGALPIAAPLPLAAEAAALAPEGRITQRDVPGHGPLITRMQGATDGAAADSATILTLAGAAGAVVARLVTSVGPGDTRVVLQTGPKGVQAARTTTVRAPDGVTTTQTDATGATILKIATRADRDGGRTTIVTDARGALVAEMRRDARGIVVAHRVVETRPVTVAAPPALLLPPTPPPTAAPAPVPPSALSKAAPKPVEAPPAPIAAATPPSAPSPSAAVAPPPAPKPPPIPKLPPVPKSPPAAEPPPAPRLPPPPPAGSLPAPLPKPVPASPPPALSAQPLAPVAPLPQALPPVPALATPLPPRRPAGLGAAQKRAGEPVHPPKRTPKGTPKTTPKGKAGSHRH